MAVSLVSLDYFKQYLRITGSSQDDANQIYLDQASGAIVQAIGVDIVQTTYPAAADHGRGDSGYYVGNNRRTIVLRNWPVTAVSSVYLDPTGYFGDNPDGDFASDTLLTVGVDYLVRWDGCLPGTSTPCSKCAILERIGGIWPGIVGYTPGWLTVMPLSGRGNIKIAYTAGYPLTAIPQPIRAATCMLAAYIRRNVKAGGNIASESQGAYSYSLFGPMAQQYPELGSIRGMLSSYREQVV